MSFLTIDRGTVKKVDTDGTVVATEAPSGTTATYLSLESLTFPGMTGVATIIVALVARLTGQAASPVIIISVAVVIGALLIVIGLLDPKRADQSNYGTFVQIVIGVFNTALLAAAMFGITEIGGGAAD
jgi:ABC-type cobalamin transport system permease subunit